MSRLKALNKFKEMNNKGDCKQLLVDIRNITYAAESKEDPFVSIAGSASKLHKMYHDRQTLELYHTMTPGSTYLKSSDIKEEALLAMDLSSK